MAKKRKSKKKAKPVKKTPKKRASKKKTVKPKSKPKVKPVAKRNLKVLKSHKEDFRVFLFLAAAVILLVLLARNNMNEVSEDEPFILPDSVITEQVGKTDTYVFYYIVANPTPDEAQCDVVVEINDLPYRNTIIMQPGEEVEAQTEVEMPGGENSIKVYVAC